MFNAINHPRESHDSAESLDASWRSYLVASPPPSSASSSASLSSSQPYDPSQYRPASTAVYNSNGGGGGRNNRDNNHEFDPMEHAKLNSAALDPMNFTSEFIVPRFASGGQAGEFGQGPYIVEPPHYTSSIYRPLPLAQSQPSAYATSISTHLSATSTNYAPPKPSPPLNYPVYDLYGSSVVSVAPSSYIKFPRPSPTSTGSLILSPASNFDPAALGLPLPPPKESGSKNVAGLYSASGFDLLGVLARVVMRPKPQISIGPVDSSCSFTVVDARRYDMPIVYASETFSKLTGYSNKEIVGINCRFLQSPTGLVAQGSTRMYTDSAAAHHMRQHIETGRECQTSLINYRKNGTPFINLCTIIPISWDSDEIAYYVGFQVDLVVQPSAILDKMKNGTYVVNYSLRDTVLPPAQEPTIDTLDSMMFDAQLNLEPTLTADPTCAIIDTLEKKGLRSIGKDVSHRQFNRMLFDHCDDFIHVLSLKGTFLYVSPSAKVHLEYPTGDLIGKSLADFCHPSDIISVLRELKEAGTVTQPTISLLYRIRRKNSGYRWIEATGKLHFEHGKGRKCVVLIGRPREVYKMSWSQLECAGGYGMSEYWSKLSIDGGGMHLYTTPNVEDILGYPAEDMIGTSLIQLTPDDQKPAIMNALQQAGSGSFVSLRHTLKACHGLLDVTTRFYSDGGTILPMKQTSVITQTMVTSSGPLPKAVRKLGAGVTGSDESSALYDATSPRGPTILSNPSSATSTRPPTLSPPTRSDVLTSNNVFDELDTTRGSSWQFELARLKQVNKKLKEEKATLSEARRTSRGRRTMGPPPRSRHCVRCGRADSRSWLGEGSEALCEACGSQWLSSASASASVSPARPSPPGLVVGLDEDNPVITAGFTQASFSVPILAAPILPSPIPPHVYSTSPREMTDSRLGLSFPPPLSD